MEKNVVSCLFVLVKVSAELLYRRGEKAAEQSDFADESIVVVST